MLKYILKRIALFIPTLIIISLISFVISLNAPGDPVEAMLQGSSAEAQNSNQEISERQYLQKRAELGLDLPVFYFVLTTKATPDTLYKIHKPNERKMVRKLLDKYGNWKEIKAYFLRLKQLERAAGEIRVSDNVVADHLIILKQRIVELKEETNPKQIIPRMDSLLKRIEQHADFYPCQQGLQSCKDKFVLVQKNRSTWKNYVPAFHWYGLKNQYHRWMSRVILKFDFGYSYQDKRPVRDKIPEAILWSLIISLCSLVISYAISIPLGVYSATHRNSVGDKFTTLGVFILYSLPPFWIATMLIIFFAGGDYFNWFPASGVQDTLHNASWSFGHQLKDWAYHLILPIFCATYGSFAYISRQMRVGMLENIRQDYVRTARAKGLSERAVIWKHAFRNSIIPIITLLGNILPALISGSVIIETIFSIPGMGRLSFAATNARDYPTIFALFTMGGFLTLLGMLISDILYALVDPRITFGKK